MEVLAGPTFTIDDVSASSPTSSSPDYTVGSEGVSTCLELDGCAGAYQGGSDAGLNMGYGIGGPSKFQLEDSSESSSSSIGVPDDSENEASGTDAEKDEDEEVQSKFRTGLGSLDSLEDSLLIKRGLSSHFSGKTKSFADLSQVNQVNEVKELQKPENPFNKRRRLLIASKLARKSSFYSWSNPKSMPLLTLDEDVDEDECQDEKAKPGSFPSPSQSPSLSSSSSSLEEKREDGEKQQLKEGRLVESYHTKMRLKLRSFKKRGCFSLMDLQEHDVHE